MNTFLTYEQIQAKCEQLNDIYEIDEEKFYSVVEKWGEREVATEDKLVASFSELLNVVSQEVSNMEKAVEMESTCRMGCAFCCYFPIIINGMEAKLMKRAIKSFPEQRRNEINIHLENYYERYKEQLQAVTSLDFKEDDTFKLKFKQQNVPCPMLNTETNKCIAYEVRPIPCRTYVSYADPKKCEDNLMPKETISFEFLYSEYMGALNEFLQFLYEEGDTAFIAYPDDIYTEDYLANWFKR